MARILIDLTTGTVLDATNVVVTDTDEWEDVDRDDFLSGTSDTQIIALGERYGTKVTA